MQALLRAHRPGQRRSAPNGYGMEKSLAVRGAGHLYFGANVLVAVVSRRADTRDARSRGRALDGVELVPMTPVEALERLGPGDAALGRLDVRATLDGVDDGLWALGVLAARGVRVLNGPAFLLATHDKLLTARLLRRAGLPHPRTQVVRGSRPAPTLETPSSSSPGTGAGAAT